MKCLSRPGRSTADGQRWVYRVEGRRRCWFQVAEGTESVKMPVRYSAARYRVAMAEENKTAARKRKAMVDARAELQRSAAVDTSRPSPSAPVQVVDAGPILATGIATRVSPAPFSKRADRLTPDEIAPRQVDVDARLAAAPAASDVVAASAPSATPLAFSAAEAGDGGQGWTWLGMLLMALGLVSVLRASRTTRWAVPQPHLSFACQRLMLVKTRPRGEAR